MFTPEMPWGVRSVGFARRLPVYRIGRSPSLRTLSTMCGRYAATANPDELVEEFEVEQDRTSEPARSILKNPQSPPPISPPPMW